MQKVYAAYDAPTALHRARALLAAIEALEIEVFGIAGDVLAKSGGASASSDCLQAKVADLQARIERLRLPEPPLKTANGRTLR